jgi:Phospholipase_D-nuclease N-terminal
MFASTSTLAGGAAVVGLGGVGILLLILVLGLLALAWIVSLFVLVMDTISVGAKILWFLALTLLAPVGIPAYFLWRHSRSGDRIDASAHSGAPGP